MKNNFICLVVLLQAYTASIVGQPLLVNSYNRNITSLNGKWNYIADPYETGYYNFHSEVYDKANPAAPSAFYNNYKAKNKQELVEYDFDKSPAMQIPGDWNTHSEKLFYYEGTIWFRKLFNYKLPKDKRLFVYFGAVNYTAHVYLNGKKLGEHEGGFTPFSFEITDIVKEQGNYLVVKADSKRTKDGIPTLNTDWWNYGGITRDVFLIEEPLSFIDDYSISLDKTNPGKIKGFVQLSNISRHTEISISIPELQLTKNFSSDNAGKLAFEFDAPGSLQYWSPENPKLYQVVIKTLYQSLKDKIGFKTIKTSGPDILLNDKPVLLKGICLHEEINGRRARSKTDAVKLLSVAKELGCNYVRLAHYPHNEYMVRTADSLGLLVWEEIPVYWTINFNNPAVLQNAKKQLTDVIARDKNRASVIIWSVANETPVSDVRNNFLKELVLQVKHLDDSRLVSAALLTHHKNDTGYIDDVIGGELDIIAFNQYRGWYGGDLKTAPQAKWITPYNKPLVVSEFGGDAKQGLHGAKDHRWTEEYQAYLYQQNLQMIKQMPNIRGISPWILMDFRSPRRMLPGIQDGFNRKGLLSDKGVKKAAFIVLKKFYTGWGLQKSLFAIKKN